MTFALSIAAGRIPPAAHSDGHACQGNQTVQADGVGQVRLSHSITPEEREHALELAELRQIHYEQEGQCLLASFMQTLIDDLIASRNQPGEQA